LKRIAVFCGSSSGARPDYANAASELADVLVGRGISLVYGGGRVGLMGRIAEAVVAGGGEVIGVIPKFLIDKELAFQRASVLHAVDTMSERKAVMAELSDAFIALPGGYGTLDELIEMLTWTQLGIHQKPCGLLNTCRYFDALMAFVDHCVIENFVADAHRNMLLVEQNAATLVENLAGYEHPVSDKMQWITDLESSS
jgi:uncharacterized protein (TIGR00730 family)